MPQRIQWLDKLAKSAANPTSRLHYLFAIISPVIATLIAADIERYLPRYNMSLVYLLVVLLTAIKTRPQPAVLCALVSFLTYNFFFTEPRYSLAMHHREDILTVTFFLITALLVGHLAARSRDQLQALHNERVEKERELLRSALLSSLSHDFRTPLASMIGASTTMIELGDALSESNKQELLLSILHESQRLDRYTQNLLDMTRLGHGELKLERDWVDISEIIHVVMKRIRPLCETSESPHLSLAANMPLLFVHAALIEQALFNIVENALKYTTPEKVNISTRQDASRHLLLIEITDDGPGIPKEEREAVFDMFHTVARGDRHNEGTGLGLAICRGMIGAHGGSVEIDDGPQKKGTTVRITLPLPDHTPNEMATHD